MDEYGREHSGSGITINFQSASSDSEPTETSPSVLLAKERLSPFPVTAQFHNDVELHPKRRSSWNPV